MTSSALSATRAPRRACRRRPPRRRERHVRATSDGLISSAVLRERHRLGRIFVGERARRRRASAGAHRGSTPERRLERLQRLGLVVLLEEQLAPRGVDRADRAAPARRRRRYAAWPPGTRPSARSARRAARELGGVGRRLGERRHARRASAVASGRPSICSSRPSSSAASLVGARCAIGRKCRFGLADIAARDVARARSAATVGSCASSFSRRPARPGRPGPRSAPRSLLNAPGGCGRRDWATATEMTERTASAATAAKALRIMATLCDEAVPPGWGLRTLRATYKKARR